MSKVFVTGANGFIGRHLCAELSRRQIEYVAGVRTSSGGFNEVTYGDFTTQKNWPSLLKGISTVIHLAARVHVMKESAVDPLVEFLKTNCEATVALAKAAKLTGIKRFIFISSVKVNGEITDQTPFKADDRPEPLDSYGVSKMEAEKALMELNEPEVFEVVIIRPPLVYGPGVQANFKKLLSLVEKNLPVPFGRVNNKRSFVSVYNLVDLIILCLDHKDAGGRVFMVSDGQDLSLKELTRKMALVSNKRPFFLPVPVFLMKGFARLCGKRSYADRLFSNLQVDIGTTKEILGWKPPYSFEKTFRVNSLAKDI